MKGKFVIADPCHEDWNSMTPEQKGRFCDVCSKCVVDFTEKKPEEILETYNALEGNVCGRFRKGQVEVAPQDCETGTTGLREPARARGGVLRRVQLFAAALLMVFSFGIFGKTQAQTGGKLMGKVAYVPENNKLTVNVTFGEEKAPKGIEVTLYNEAHEVVQTAKVSEDGSAVFKKVDAGQYYAYARGMGYESEQKPVYIRHDQQLDLRMEEEIFDMGDVEYIPEDIRVPEPIEEIQPIEEEIIEPIEEEEIMIKGEMMYVPEPEEQQQPEPELTQMLTVEPVEPLEVVELEAPCKCLHEPVLISPLENSEALTESDPLAPEAGPEAPAVLPKLTVSPNPTRDIIFYTLEPTGGKGALILADANGRVLWSRKDIGKEVTEDKLDLTTYPAGIYFLTWRTESDEISRRIVKVR